jgi:hypothetical protein
METGYLKCQKCGAVMIREEYHQYGWYLNGQKVEGCPSEAGETKVNSKDSRSMPEAREGAKPE